MCCRSVYLTVALSDIRDEKIELTNALLTFRGKSEGKDYTLSLEFLHAVLPEAREGMACCGDPAWAETFPVGERVEGFAAQSSDAHQEGLYRERRILGTPFEGDLITLPRSARVCSRRDRRGARRTG